VHLTITAQSSGAQRPFDHSVLKLTEELYAVTGGVLLQYTMKILRDTWILHYPIQPFTCSYILLIFATITKF